ncbi:MAG: ammonium transporter [Slackia sp.]
MAFQLAFAAITAAIITGSLAGRMKFAAVIAFIAIWSVVVYAPLAHMVWGGDGSFIGDKIGALDFAGGDVVHISSGLTGLVLAVLLGKRRGFGMMAYRPHNVPFVLLGAGLLWFGWFGFNAGSAFAADAVAALALLNTMVAPAAAMLAWMLVEAAHTRKVTLVGACTGVVTGLVAITPAAGFVDVWAAVVMGVVTAPICYAAIAFLKPRFGYDDALDAFGCHTVGGIVAAFDGRVLCSRAILDRSGRSLYTGDPSLLVSQLLGILVTIAFVAVATLVIGFVLKAAFHGLRVDAREEGRLGCPPAWRECLSVVQRS